LDSAIADLSQAIRIEPRDALAAHARGVAYRERRDFERAIADFDSALKLDPNSPPAMSTAAMPISRRATTTAPP